MMAPRRCGRVTWTKRCQRVAPSTLAASYRSAGHRLQVGEDQDREEGDSAPQFGDDDREEGRGRLGEHRGVAGPDPELGEHESRAGGRVVEQHPDSGRQHPDTAHGEKISARISPRPRNRSLTIRASSMPSTSCSATWTATQSTVVRRLRQNSGSSVEHPPEVVQSREAVVVGHRDVVVLQAVVEDAADRIDQERRDQHDRGCDQQVGRPPAPAGGSPPAPGRRGCGRGHRSAPRRAGWRQSRHRT